MVASFRVPKTGDQQGTDFVAHDLGVWVFVRRWLGGIARISAESFVEFGALPFQSRDRRLQAFDAGMQRLDVRHHMSGSAFKKGG